MCDAAWRAIRVDSSGWRVVTDPPLLFRRYAPHASICEPAVGVAPDEINTLRRFVNVRDDGAWRELVAWLVAAWIPEIAHPLLVVSGEQGTAKSTLMRMLCRIIDPSRKPLRSVPTDITQWVQTADHSWMVTLDNVSALPDWLSDALCRAVTGEAFSKRMLYTDSEDVILEFRRVIALTGIEVVAQRSDLLDRSILLRLEPIAATSRRAENHVMAEYNAALPKIIGALLSLLSGVLRELDSIRLDDLPRMADFARVGVAVEQALGWPTGSFLSAYGSSLTEQNDEALSSVLIAEPLMQIIEDEWCGTSSELLKLLTGRVEESVSRRSQWPKSAKALNGQLRRIAPNLRACGIGVRFGRDCRKRTIYLTRLSPEKCVTSVISVTPSVKAPQINDASASLYDTS